MSMVITFGDGHAVAHLLWQKSIQSPPFLTNVGVLPFSTVSYAH